MSENTNTTKRRSAIRIMGSLIGLVKPLLHIMLAAIILGTLGYLCAIFLTILAGQVIMHGLLTGVAGMIVPVDNMWLVLTPVKTIITVMIVIAVLRGILHYMEQYCQEDRTQIPQCSKDDCCQHDMEQGFYQTNQTSHDLEGTSAFCCIRIFTHYATPPFP